MKIVLLNKKWLAVVFIGSFIGVLSLVVGMIMVKKWFSIRNNIISINTSVSKAANQQAGAISHLNTIMAAETASVNDCQKEYIIKYE